ncbi:MAG: hypothetical protein PHD43_23140 [Methylococcales bacterium]|nr:hypothetical protein [Methylococcales bacterium]
MNIGTRSLLFGVHQVLIHPWFVALAWWKLYGVPLDPRLWVAFIIHDWGYWGQPNMDGPEGELHPVLGASMMYRWFGKEWSDMCMYHSRFLAKRYNRPYSRLCVADKLAISLTPAWLYLPLAFLSGEIKEYMTGKWARTSAGERSARKWLCDVQQYCSAWAYEHKTIKDDTWTGTQRDLAIHTDK